MEKETDFYTGTMAKVYAGQGHWDKAAEIYRHLLRMEPERTDYLEALAEACVEIYRDAWLPSGEPGAIRHARADLGASG